MADVSKFQMPDGTVYNVKDVVGRGTANAAQSAATAAQGTATAAQSAAAAAQNTATEALNKANRAFSVSYAEETITFANIGGA